MNKFATSINCMDGRVQLPVHEFIKINYEIDFVDTITLPGANKLLAEENWLEIQEFVKKCLEISLKKHKSNLIAIVGHYDCAGNPTDKENQNSHTLRAMDLVKSWYPETKIIGLWVNEHWAVEKIKELP
ncbi:MAG: hypothetical protein N3B16_05805 [Candidatus Aminicenantes bacterium]|nr:hypothetical protein [Candidatus Aminicenantes bacterium]